MPKSQRPSTIETFKAYFRQGLHELGNALYGQGTAAAQPEYGMVGTKLPSEIARDLRGGHQTAPTHQQPSPLDKYTSQNHEAPSQQAGTHEQHRESMTHER